VLVELSLIALSTLGANERGGTVKIAAVVALIAVVFACIYAGHQAVRSWRSSSARLVVRLREAEQ
jgi:hypothetical protein